MHVSAKFVDQRLRRCRHSHFAVKNFVAVYVVAIHGFVSTLVGLHYGTIQAHSSEHAFGTRIRQNLGIHFQVGASGRITAYRPGGYRGIRAKFEFVAEQALQVRDRS
jgi:hypothetical protein